MSSRNERKRQAQPSTGSTSPDSHRSKLLKSLKAQLAQETAADTIDDDALWDATMKAIAAGRNTFNRAVDEFVQRPRATTAHHCQITDEQRRTTRILKEAISQVVDGSLTEDGKGDKSESMRRAVADFASSFEVKVAGKVDTKVPDWEPKRYRVLDPGATGYTEGYRSSPEGERILKLEDVPEVPGLSSRDMFATWRREYDVSQMRREEEKKTEADGEAKALALFKQQRKEEARARKEGRGAK